MTEFTDSEKNRVESGTLYLVATPIGNLSDISERAVKVLNEVSFIAAEDTRVTAKLLFASGIRSPLFSYHEHNKKEAGEKIIERLKSGQSCAVVTDAGTPAISDPGEDIVKSCIDSNIPVVSVPGACAAITALTVSGLSTRRFAFEGFLEGSDAEKRSRLAEIASDKRTTVFYEAPHRLSETLSIMLSELGDRRISLCRELTKINEEILRVRLSEAVRIFESTVPRGEFVIVVEGCTSEETPFWENMTVSEHVAYYSQKMGMDKMSAMKATAKDRGVSKNSIYKELI